MNTASILGKSLSDNAFSAIKSIESNLKKPVVYAFTDPKITKSFGQCDFNQPDAYYVYSKQSLLNITKANQPNIPFETNLLHELFHLCQIEEGYPTTAPISLFATGGIDLGSLIISSILDMNVDTRLRELGYTSSYFYKHRLSRAEKIARKGIIYADACNFVSMSIQLTALNILYPGPDTQSVLSLFGNKNPGLVNCVRELSSGISQIGYDSPESAFRSLVYLFSAFDLFRTHLIFFRDQAYTSISSVKQDFQGIRIVPR